MQGNPASDTESTITVTIANKKLLTEETSRESTPDYANRLKAQE